jgi:putative transposase
MPRGARLDAPQALHHVMARGIDRQTIFHDDLDRDEFVSRLWKLAGSGAFELFAWALVPNHFHLLLKTARTPLSQAMRSLLTGHALWFNRRHGRVGHVFQNRYKSIVCEEEPYFLELVRYIHLNPLRAGIVATLEELDGYPYSGHSGIIGCVPQPWQQTQAVLEWFGSNGARARTAYRRFVSEGLAHGERKDLTGGGLRRSAAGWMAIRELRRGRESFTHDERVLGSPSFVESVLQEPPAFGTDDAISLADLVDLVCAVTGTEQDQLLGSERPRSLSRAREGIAFLWINHLRRSAREVATRLGMSLVSAYRCAKRGSRAREEWCRVLSTRQKVKR